MQMSEPPAPAQLLRNIRCNSGSRCDTRSCAFFRMAFNALQRAVNVRALRAKTLHKWIVRILMMLLLLMISDTNDTENNNCYVNLFI